MPEMADGFKPDLRALVAAARCVPIERIIAERGIELRGRTERVGPCPICGGHDRFSINTIKRLFNCRGCQTGGDVIALVQFLDSASFSNAIASLTGQRLPVHQQHHPAKDRARIDDYGQRQRAKARWLWRRSIPAPGTLVEAYLRECRGIIIPLPMTVRFLSPAKPDHHAAMIVPFGLPDEPEPGTLAIAKDKIAAVQLTLLKPDGNDKADVKPNKIAIGSRGGLPMVLAPPNDLLGLAICEGIEDALSAHDATGLGTWAAGAAGFLPALADVIPSCIESVTIYAHDDGGRRFALELAERASARGFEVRVEGVP